MRQTITFGLNKKSNQAEKFHGPTLFKFIADEAVLISKKILEGREMIDMIKASANVNANDEVLKIFNCKVRVKIHQLKYLNNLTENTQCFCIVEIAGKEFKSHYESIENLSFDQVSIHIFANGLIFVSVLENVFVTRVVEY